MWTPVEHPAPAAPACSHELRFASLYNAGRGIVVPCDASGHVDMDALPERLRNAYLGARAMVGREYLFPTVRVSAAPAQP